MFIFVDESGTFSPAPDEDSWCVVAAYLSPEFDRVRLERLVRSLRAECSKGHETKLSQISEARYCHFLEELSLLHGAAFAVAVDSGLHTAEDLRTHKAGQARAIAQNAPRMLHDAGRVGVLRLAAEVEALPNQLYAQLVCQIRLFHHLLARGVTYFAQRYPRLLGNFRWRIDQKDVSPTAYERAFKNLLPGILQTESFENPMLMLIGADYSSFKRFEYPQNESPTFAHDYLGLPHEDNLLDIGKLVRENFALVDSATSPGVQVADLLASGLRRAMRGHFDNPAEVGRWLGANMVQAAHDAPPLHLISLARTRDLDDGHDARATLDAMTRAARPLIARGTRGAP